MTRKNATIKGETIYLDDNVYDKCKFIECEIVYKGGDEVTLLHCIFEDCTWALHGAAANTMQYLERMYMFEGMKQMIDQTFENAKGNHVWADVITDETEKI